MGLMVGRQEVGPRALGHRSLFAIPTTQKMKDRLNKIKVCCSGHVLLLGFLYSARTTALLEGEGG